MIFPLAAVLSITTGRLLCETGQLYEILNFLTGDNLFTHQLPRAIDECQPVILDRYPSLVGVDLPAVFKGAPAIRGWVDEKAKALGFEAGLDLEPIPADQHVHRNPLEELMEMRAGKPVIVVVAPEKEGGS